MASNSDQHIINKIRQGDEIAFSKLFDQYYTSLCFFSNKYLNDIDLSRSVTQEFFIDFWVKREKIKITQSVKSYLFNSVKNRSIDQVRKNKKSSQNSELTDDIATAPFKDLVEEAELNDLINQSINELPDKCREVFMLCRFEGLKYAQIAEQLDISIKTVEMQMGIALKKLRKRLSDIQMINLLSFITFKKK